MSRCFPVAFPHQTMRWFILQLFLLLSPELTIQSSIHLTQTRVTLDSEPKWPVMGVASVELGTDILGYRFDCTSSVKGYSMTLLTWERVGHTINPFEVSRTSNGGSRLEVERIQLTEANLGQYRCIHRGTGDNVSLLITDASPAVIPARAVVTAQLHHSLTLLVHISTHLGPLPENNTVWRLPSGRGLTESDPNVQHHITGSELTVTNITTDDLGEYTCTVTLLQEDTLYTNATSLSIRLFTPATIARHPIPVTVLEEENATLTCTATGSPELSIMWKRVGEPSTEVSPSTGVHVYVTETAAEGGQEVAMTTTISSMLTLHHVSSDDAGLYLCEASNQLDELSSTVKSVPVSITVTSLTPTVAITYNNITSRSHTVNLFSGDSNMLAFSCLADGHPFPSVSWNIALSHPSSVTEHYTYVLTQTELILVWDQSPEASDTGVYECIAKNSHGEQRALVNLTVIDRPVIDSVIPAPGVKVIPIVKENPAIQFEVPTNSIGSVLTCSGYGWPTPHIQWTALSSDFPCETSSIVSYNHGIATAELVFDTPFNGSCVGAFECRVTLYQFNVESNSSFRVLLIEGGKMYSPKIISFQLRLKRVSVECTSSMQHQKIIVQLERALSRALTTAGCDQSAKNITVSTLSCSKEDSVVLEGALSIQSSTSSTEKVLYLLLQWKNSGPLISFNDSLCEVDAEFPLCSQDSLACEHMIDTCTSETKDTSKITLILFICCGVLFVVVLLTISFLLYKKVKTHLCHFATTKMESYELQDDAEKRNSYVSTTTSRSDEPVLH